ncbi:MAG: AAA family ATPase [Anaerolineales bacterium]|nr:AAA family ATPase [Anaerolineales bacterium]
MSTICLSLLGSFEISPAEATALRRKERVLLAYLAVQTRPLPRQMLISLFFARADDPAAALRLSLSRIRRTLGSDIILTEGRTVQWNPRAGEVDHKTFVSVLNDFATHSADALAAALAMYHGEFLTGLALEDAPEADLWLLQERAHLQTLYERGALELIRRQRLAGQWDTAIQQTRALLIHNPLLESAHAHLLWLYHQTGQPDAARTHYEIWHHLAQEMGIPPSSELQQLAEGEHHPGTFSPTRISAPFAGREVELRALHTCWQDAHKGQGRFILLEGEAGAGKSTLVEHFARQFALPLLSGNSYETTRHLPYTPWTELLENTLNAASSKLVNLSVYSREAFARFLPGWGTRLGIVRSELGFLATEGQEASHLYQAFTDGLYFLFEGAKPILFLDNLQWADEASLTLLHFTARRAFRDGWLIVGAHRAATGGETSALNKMLEGLHPRVERFALSGLSVSAVTDLIALLWPQLPSESRTKWATRLTEATGGNPFFISELLRELAQQEPEPESLPVPASIRDLVQHRLQGLPSGGQRVLGALAVLDVPATPAYLQKMSERLWGETVDLLDEGWQRGLLRVDGEQYAFAHDLVREAVLAGVSPVRKRWLHKRAVEMLVVEAEGFPPSARGEMAGRILHHAKTGDVPTQVFAWGHEAAEYAFHLNAIREAYQAVEASMAAFVHVEQDEANTRLFIQLLLDSAWLINLMGCPVEEERTRLEEARGLLARYPEPELQGLYHLREASVLSGEGRYTEAIPAALNAYEYFMDLGDTLSSAWSIQSAGRYEITLSHNRAGRALFTQALELYRACGGVRGEAIVLSNLAWVNLNMGEPGIALEGLARALTLARETGDILGQAEICTTFAATWNFFYRADLVRFYAQEASMLFRKVGLPDSRARLYLGTAAWVSEGMEAAQMIFQEVHNHAVAQNDLWLQGWVAQLLGRQAFYTGDLERAEIWFEEATRLRGKTGEQSNQISDLSWLARLRLARGEVETATELTTQAIQRMIELTPEAWVFEKWDVYRTHAAVLAARGYKASAAQYNQLADEAIASMADQTPDAATREGFLKAIGKF